LARPALAVCAAGKVATVALLPLHPWAAAAVFFGGDLFVLYHLLMPNAQGMGRTFTHFAPNARDVWLTIDDGPDPEDTPRLLELLARYQARATFFVVGERAAKHPELIAEIVRQGHDVAHHTYSHPAGSFWWATPRRVKAELDRTLDALRIAGVTPRWFRAPVGIKNLFLEPALRARGLQTVAWNVRSLDGIVRDPARVAERVRRYVQPGAIILMHEGPRVAPAVRVTAIALVLEWLRAEGYRCVLPTADQLR
jgi:peptidoglycan/xylan/chitin deacetylase (PgdA/CDA1 family)